jgi:hypothetical protein
MKPKCKKCAESYPQERRDMGYKVCVSCSTEPGWSCSALTFHKTGNSIEIIKDPEVAYNINQMASRKNFGVMSGITGRYRRYQEDTNVNRKRQEVEDKTGMVTYGKVHSVRGLNGNTVDFDKQGAEALRILNDEGLSSSIDWLKTEYKEFRLSQKDFVKITQILKAINK